MEERLKNAVVLYIGSSQAMVNNKETQVDSSNSDVKPYVKDSRTLVPVRFISESMGADVGWDASSSTVTITLDGKVLKLVIGNKTLQVGKEKISLDVAPEIKEGRTFLPLRSISEAVGKKVFYDRGLIVISDDEAVFDAASEKSMIDEVISKVNNLPVVGSAEALAKLMEKSTSRYDGLYRGGIVFEADEAQSADDAVNAPTSSKSESSSGSASEKQSDYSGTNLQVQGVDEADVVKTDGQYIYQVNNDRIVVAKAYPADKMDIMSILDFTDDNFTPQEIYLSGDLLVSIGSYYENSDVAEPYQKAADEKMYIRPPYYYQKNSVKAIVCDISDKTNIKKIREVEIEGNYVSSRMIGSVLYMVSNKYQNFYYTTGTDVENQTPSYRDTIISEDYVKIDCPQIRYFPDSVESNYMIVSAFDINKDEKANIQTYLGAGENIYVSNENLFVAVSNYNYDVIALEEKDVSSDAVKPAIAPVYVDRRETNVYKFSLDGSKITYLSKGSVPGLILNQFSMDENKGYFRIATTTGEVWGTGVNASGNNLYILDDTMNIVGKLEGIAPGEKIYSVRFMGDRGYIVTFKTVDPLFVIDLKDPTKPEILGALKIPGYSDYLHPYDENHIIGFGKDTIEMSGGGFYMGMKIALFDVSDVSNPVQKFSEVIGDRGTDSELLRNHKALLFSKEKNLLAFPVTVAEIKGKDQSDENMWGVPEYGEFAFQGAYVYNIDLNKGFTLKGRITHISEEEYLKAGNYYYSDDKFVERILYIDDTLYTLSKGMYKAHGIEDLKEKGVLTIPAN
ncbi:MAG: Beta propeller domain protein [Firmicutes bacterium ADurb.Bin419]|nr:MAG: Beta propeller domain protein [Firmicutes bacterium ADurb.Bin419]